MGCEGAAGEEQPGSTPRHPESLAHALVHRVPGHVVLLFIGLALVLGRRGGWHVACWVAPFMIVSRAVRNTVGWPSLRLIADRSACKRCGACTTACSMSVDVKGVWSARVEWRTPSASCAERASIRARTTQSASRSAQGERRRTVRASARGELSTVEQTHQFPNST